MTRPPRPDRLAIDVVLLPPPALARLAVRANRLLAGQPRAGIRLGPGRDAPHVTLAMACVERAAVAGLLAELARLARAGSPLTLAVAGVALRPAACGPPTAWLAFEPGARLLRLHARVASLLAPLHRSGTRREHLALRPGERLRPSTLHWVDEFLTRASGRHFEPHLTLGHGRPRRALAWPRAAEFALLALYQLGNRCTCRVRLGRWRLGPRG